MAIIVAASCVSHQPLPASRKEKHIYFLITKLVLALSQWTANQSSNMRKYRNDWSLEKKRAKDISTSGPLVENDINVL
jgi:hypothetical protein